MTTRKSPGPFHPRTRVAIICLSMVSAVAPAAFSTAQALPAVDARTTGEADRPDEARLGPIPIPNGFMLIEGDLLVPENYFSNPSARSATGLFWIQGIVPFEFNANVSTSNRLRMKQAMDEWHASGAATAFVPRTGESDFLRISDGTANFVSAPPGNAGGQKECSIFNWDFRFIMAHELSHALGFWHEQSRPDRNQFVTINLQNVCQNCCNNGSCDSQFAIRPNSLTFNTPYDDDSVMHYGACAFSSCNDCDSGDPNCRTITTTDPNSQNSIGQRDHLSFWDQEEMQQAYGIGEQRFVDATAGPSGDGSLTIPFPNLPPALTPGPPNTRVFIRAGTYSTGNQGVLSVPMRLFAYQGSVTLRP